jgi:hypothetical protein
VFKDKREEAQLVHKFVNLIEYLRSLNYTRATDLQVLIRLFVEGFFPLLKKDMTLYLYWLVLIRAYYHMFHATQTYVTNITYVVPYIGAKYKYKTAPSRTRAKYKVPCPIHIKYSMT